MNVLNYGVGITEDRHQKLVMQFYSNKKRIWNRFYAYKVIEQHQGKVPI